LQFKFLLPLQHTKRPASQSKRVVVLPMAFRVRKRVFGTFEKRAPGVTCLLCLFKTDEGVPRHETLQLFSFLFPLQDMKTPALQNKRVVVLRWLFGPEYRLVVSFPAKGNNLYVKFRLYVNNDLYFIDCGEIQG